MILPREARAIFVKDVRIFPRDLRNLQQLIFPLAMAAIWAIQLAWAGARRSDVDGLFGTIGMAAAAFFVCATIAGALGGPGIGREGRSFWLLKVAPISPRRLLLGKLALAYTPFPLAGGPFVAALALLGHSSLHDSARALALLLLAGLGASSISTGMGAAFPRLDWENPQQQTTFRAGCLAGIVQALYLGLALALALGLPAAGEAIAPALAPALAALGWFGCAAFTAIVCWGSIAFGAARLDRLEV